MLEINTAVLLFNFSPLGYFRHHTCLRRKQKELLYDNNPRQKLLGVIWQYQSLRLEYVNEYSEQKLIPILNLFYMFYETISRVGRERVSHFRPGLPFYLKHLLGNYSPFMFQFYQRLGHVR